MNRPNGTPIPRSEVVSSPKKVIKDDNETKFVNVLKKHNKDMTRTQICDELGVGNGGFYKIVVLRLQNKKIVSTYPCPCGHGIMIHLIKK